jgi:Zn-dependent peptidase ImmA (M78 family)
MTLLRDAVDNFWFTLLHEIAHVVLHYRTGLSAGFFDDVTSTEVDELEGEANAFAGNLLIPKRSGRGRQRESRRRPSRSRGWRSGSVSTRP